MKRGIFLLGLSLLFLVACNDGDKTTNITNDNNPSSSEIANESSNEDTKPSTDSSTSEPTSTTESSSTNTDSKDDSTTTKSSHGNIDNGGTYTEDSDGEWEYLG